MTDFSNGGRPLAVVTGASTGIGYELAMLAARTEYDLLIAADEREIENAAADFRATGVDVQSVIADLATFEGIDKLYHATLGRPVDLLLVNTGRGLGRPFLDQAPEDWHRVVDINISGTIYLIQKIGRDMRARGSGKILITGSIVGLTPGTYQAVYNGAKAFLDSFSFAIRHELKGSGVGVTCLMLGATEAEFFERADRMDSKVGTEKQADPATVARDGFDAMMRDKGSVVSGWQSKLQAAIMHITPHGKLVEMDRRSSGPGALK
jgi:short-subunit dehydrogenase